MVRLEVDGDRLWSTLMASAEIGALSEGGLRRLALSDADRQMRDLLASWAAESGYQVSVDQLGTMILRRRGTSEALPPVVIGSHLDTQWAGGRFDGILGVLAGLEVLRSLDENGIETLRSIEVVNWTNEEGALIAQEGRRGREKAARPCLVEYVQAERILSRVPTPASDMRE